MGEWFGVALALVSSCLGGTAAAVTRYLILDADPITLAGIRWGIGFLCVLPTAVLLRVRWPPVGMGSGAAALILFASLTGRIGALQGFGASRIATTDGKKS